MPRGIPASKDCEVCKGLAYFRLKPRADITVYACAECLLTHPYFALCRKILGIMEQKPCENTQ